MNSSKVKKSFDFLAGGGEMGERIRQFDWSATPLGEPDTWDHSLKTIVRIMLTSSQPIWIGWGKELIKLYNDPYKAIVGGKHPEALGQPASVVWKDIWTDIEPMLKQVMEKNEGTYVESQLLIMQRYGYPEETYYTFSYSPVPGDNGGTGGMICYNTPETEQIINERALKTIRNLGQISKQNNLDDLYTATAKALEENNKDFPCAVISKIENEGNLAIPVAFAGIDSNHAEVPKSLDLTSDGVREKNIARAVAENKIIVVDNDGRWKNLPKGAWDIMPSQFAHLPIKAGNKPHPIVVITVALNPYRKFDDTYRNFLQLVIDQVSLQANNVLTYEEERKRAEALEQIDKAKTVFFSNISHEFRTPLTLMLGPLEELLNHPQSSLSAAERESIETTHRNALRLMKLVNSLLDFSRIEAGRQQANFSLVDMAALTHNLASNFRSVIEKAGLQFNIHTNGNMQPVYLDKEMYEKIVFNLLSNAFKYTLHGSITVTLEPDTTHAVLSIKDTGVGIPGHELPHMFDRFHRVQNSGGRTYEGTGIGLSLVKELVQFHHGDISVTSKPGEGSTFTVKIPFGKEHLSAKQSGKADEEYDHIPSGIYVAEAGIYLDDSHETEISFTNTGEETPLILVVDDNADMRKYIQSVLAKKFNIITAHDGQDALNKIKKKRPDLVLTDIMMPVLDGIGLLREVKNNTATANIPVILLTARAGEESKIEGWETGADDYLVKPFSSRELITRISSQIHTARVRAAARENLESIIQQAPVAMTLLTGPNLIIDIANDQALEIWARVWDEVKHRPVFEVFPELVEQGLQKVMHDVYTTGIRFTANQQPVILNRRGKMENAYYSFTFEPIRNAKGEVYSILVAGINVTNETIASKKIAASEENVRNLFLQTPVGIAVYKGENLVIELINDTMLSFWGRTREQSIGTPLWELLPETKSQGFDKIAGAVYKTGIPYTSPETLVTIMRNGKMENVYSRYSFQPRKDEHGNIIGLLGIANDITEQVLARQEIEKSERQLKEMANAMPQLVWIAEASGKVIYYNDRIGEFAGSKKGDDGKWIWDGLVHPEDLDGTQQAWNTSVATGQVYEWQHRIQLKDGSYRWFLSRAYPQKDEQGKITNWFGTATDIHTQKTFSETLERKVNERTEELNTANSALEARNTELNRQNEELASFTYVASHDLQEPLRKIQIISSRILQQQGGQFSDITKDYFNRISSASLRMQNLIEALLNYSKTNAANNSFVKTDLNSLLEEVKSNLQDSIEEKHATIESEPLPEIDVIPHQFSQLLLNILSNSIKYSRPGVPPVIKITVEKVPSDQILEEVDVHIKNYWKFTLTDNGIGFEQEYSKKIFELFQRLHGKNEYSGTGIGLAICKKIVQNHNGIITAKGEVGVGAVFTVYLPQTV